MESVLPDQEGHNPAGAADITQLLALAQRLLAASPRGRLLFTSREPLPKPFAHPINVVELGRLSETEAIRLVEQVMARHGWEPPLGDNANTPEEIVELVDTVDRHPRALVLLAREVATGVRATARHVARLMADLEARNPADRENSLYASVALSLRRLPQAVRERVDRLAVFHGGGYLATMAMVMEIDVERIGAVAEKLIEVGLAERQEYDYLQLDPALPAYLGLEQSLARLAELEGVWNEAMIQLVGFLYEQRSKDSTMAQRLTLLELPNLLALLKGLERRLEADCLTAEAVSQTAGLIEQLLARLGRPQALARAAAVRKRAAAAIPAWGNARFADERLQIERLLQHGQLQPANDRAQALLEKAEAAGPAAYPEADFDLAGAHFLLGRVLKRGGQAAPALELLVEAQKRFEALGEPGECMASVALAEQAECLVNLGQLDVAAETYEEAIEWSEKLKDNRQVALGKTNLATVWIQQGKYTEAITGHEEARVLFERLNEPDSVAIAWHQLGIAHHGVGNFDEAETAYRNSLAIFTRTGNRAGQASSLLQLGNLYGDSLNRPAEAVTFYRQVAAIRVKLDDLRSEGLAHSNVAITLGKLERYDEARKEVRRAIECVSPFGHAAEPWKTFDILHQIETAVGNRAAARTAWGQARDAYLAYRRQGGYAQARGGQLCDQLLAGLSQGGSAEITQELEAFVQAPDTPEFLKLLIPKLLQIVDGARDPALADDPALSFSNAAEILFFIERLEA